MTVLVVDDSQLVRRQVVTALTSHGFEAIEAVDGIDAQAKLGAHVALVICDLNMPRMNGLELLAWMRETRSETPFVMFSTDTNAEVAQRAKHLGAKAYLAKPFRAEVVVAVVEKLLGRRTE